MSDASAIHSTFVIQRNYPKPPEQVFSAFADTAKKRRSYAEGRNHEVEDFKMDFRIGGTEYVRYRFSEGTPFKGVEVTNDGSFQDIVLNRRVVIASHVTFGEKPISVSLVTIELLPAGNGTDLICTHQGVFFEGADGPRMREAGWRQLFEKLKDTLPS